MTGEQESLLAVLDEKILALMSLCERQKEEILTLRTVVLEKEQDIEDLKQYVSSLTSKCDNMLTARVLSVNHGELRNARSRLSQLVREVDECIALLNE